jgi:hypothetical protein
MNTFKENSFVLKPDSKIYWVKDMPIRENYGGTDYSRIESRYNSALQSAIDNAVEVSNQNDVKNAFWSLWDEGQRMEVRTPYSLLCSVEIKQGGETNFFPTGIQNHTYPVALVTFPESESQEETQEQLIELVRLAFNAMKKIRSEPTMSGTRYYPVPADYAPFSASFFEKLNDFCAKNRNLVDQITRK